MFYFHHHSHIVSVICTFIVIFQVSSFGMGITAYHVKRSFGLFQGKIFVMMSYSYHVDMFHTHFENFTHCRTSVVIVVVKCIFCVTLEMGCHNVVSLRKVCRSRVLRVPCCIIK